MCVTCGCDGNQEARITNMNTPPVNGDYHTHTLADGTLISHSHIHEHHHQHDQSPANIHAKIHHTTKSTSNKNETTNTKTTMIQYKNNLQMRCVS